MALALPTFKISISPVIVAIVLAFLKVKVIPLSNSCAALNTIVPAPLTVPAPLDTVGIAEEVSIPIPVTALTPSLIPFLDDISTLVLAEPTVFAVVVVVTSVNSTFKFLNLTS